MEKKWAFITGSSTGIGKAMALELARKNYHIIIHGRNVDALKEVESEVLNSGRTKCLTFIQDLSKEDAFSKTKEFIESHKVNLSIVINNAGYGVDGKFQDIPLDAELAMIHVHVNYPIQLSKYLMNKCTQQLYIMNVGSLYSFFPVPRQNSYAASKAFIHYHSLAVYKEMLGTNIHISSLCPGLTYSEFRTRNGHKEKYMPIGMTCEEVARIAIVSLLKKKPLIVPGKFNKFFSFIIPKLPKRLGLWAIDTMNGRRGY